MFGFRKSKEAVYAPLNGKCKDITKCVDPAFAQKMLGDGFLIEATEDVVCSPCSGKLVSVYPAKHAFGVEMENGQQVLVHIGIDTVNLKGVHFKKLKSQGQMVRAGTPIIQYDREAILEEGYNTDIIVIVVDEEEVEKHHIDEMVSPNDQIIEKIDV